MLRTLAIRMGYDDDSSRAKESDEVFWLCMEYSRMEGSGSAEYGFGKNWV